MAASRDRLVEMAECLIREAEQRGADLRLLGGLAFYITCPRATGLPGLSRDYQDLDFAVNKKGARPLVGVFTRCGWEPDRHFNALHGQNRMLFTHPDQVQADIFIGAFEQCHRLDLEKDLSLSAPTLPVTDLLLTKLQIHQVNAKDIQDIYTLLVDHTPKMDSPGPQDIDLGRVTELTSEDWGWYTTIHDNLQTLQETPPVDLERGIAVGVQERLETIREAMETAPKRVKWTLRNAVGRRVLWYEEPEEVHR